METTTAPRAQAQTRRPRATLALICTGYFGLVIAACAFLVGAVLAGGTAREPG